MSEGYPTAWAYEQACKTIRAREAQIFRWRKAFQHYFHDGAELCRQCGLPRTDPIHNIYYERKQAMYILINGSEDGASVRMFQSEAGLRLAVEEGGFKTFRSALDDMDHNNWPEHSCLIIRGDVVLPIAKATVTEWDFGYISPTA